MKFLPVLLALIGISLTAFSQNTPIIFILDASGSMWGQIEGKAKMEIATSVLSDAVGKLDDGQPVGLVAYGHRQKGDCSDVEFLLPKENTSNGKVLQALKGIKPLGKTPLALSASIVIDDLKATKAKATIILITDGIESCNGDLCDVVRKAKQEGIKFKLHVVGFGLKEAETKGLECAANEGDGQYYDADNAEDLSDILNEATNTTIDEPEANCTVYATKNDKAVDATVKIYKAGSSKAFKATRTFGDTAKFYLPAGQYDYEVQALGGSDVKPFKVTKVNVNKDKHTHRTIALDAGVISVTTLNNGEAWDAVVSIYPKEGKIAAQGRTYGKTTEFELKPGIYNLELKAMKISGKGQIHRIEEVKVSDEETANIACYFESGILRVGAKSDIGLVDAVIAIKDVKQDKSIAQGRTYTAEKNNPKAFMLSPGLYEVTIKALGDHKGKTEVVEIEVESGKEVEKIIEFK